MRKNTFFTNSLLLILFCLLFNALHAQEEKETGPSYFLFPEFIKGSVLKGNGALHEVMLNYNMWTEEMIFDQDGTKLALDLSDPIDTVYIQGRKFFLLNKKFVELIYDSKISLYVENKCKVKDPGKPAAYGGKSQTSATDTYSSYYTQGQVYKLNMPEKDVTKPYFEYWLKRDNKLTKFFNLNQLAKLYKDKKEIFNEYVENHEVKYNNQQNMVELIKYLESN